MPRHVQKSGSSGSAQEVVADLDFTPEEKGGRFHALPAQCMGRIWDSVKEGGGEGQLFIGTDADHLMEVRGNLSYMLMVTIAGQVGGAANVKKLTVRGVGPNGVKAATAIQMAYEDNFGSASGRTGREYVRLMENGVLIQPPEAPQAVSPIRAVKDSATEFAGQCREVAFSRFPGTRTGQVVLGTAHPLEELSSEVQDATFISAGQVRGEVGLLKQVQHNLYDEYNRNVILLAFNMLAEDRAGFTTETSASPEFYDAMNVLLPYIHATDETSRTNLGLMRLAIGAQHQIVRPLLRSIIRDVTYGRTEVISRVDDVGVGRVVEDLIVGKPEQVDAVKRLRAERELQEGLIVEAINLIESPNGKTPNAQLAVETVYIRDFTASQSELIIKARKRVIEALSTGETQKWEGFGFPEGSVLVCENLPPVAAIPILHGKGAGGILATHEVSRYAHEKIVSAALGLPLAGGFHELREKIRKGEQILVDDRQENTHMVVLISPTDAAKRDYGVSERKPRASTNIGKHGGRITLSDGTQISLSGTLQFIEKNAIANVRNAKADGIGLIRSEIDLYSLGDVHWMTFGDEQSRERLEEVYFDRARELLKMWEHLGGSVTFRLPDVSPEKISPLLYHAFEQLRDALRISPLAHVPLGIDLLMQYPDDMIYPIMRGITRAVLDVHPRDFRDDSRPRDSKFRVYIEMPSVENKHHVDMYYQYCARVESDLDVVGAFGRKVMIENLDAIRNIDDVTRGFDDVGLGLSDLTKSALGIETRLDPRLNALHPKALLTINEAVGACIARGYYPQGCGPMTEDVYSLMLLIGTGVRRVSVNPPLIDYLAGYLEKASVAECERLLRGATRRDPSGKLVYTDGEDVFKYVIAQTNGIFR